MCLYSLLLAKTAFLFQLNRLKFRNASSKHNRIARKRKNRENENEYQKNTLALLLSLSFRTRARKS